MSECIALQRLWFRHDFSYPCDFQRKLLSGMESYLKMITVNFYRTILFFTQLHVYISQFWLFYKTFFFHINSNLERKNCNCNILPFVWKLCINMYIIFFFLELNFLFKSFFSQQHIYISKFWLTTLFQLAILEKFATATYLPQHSQLISHNSGLKLPDLAINNSQFWEIWRKKSE